MRIAAHIASQVKRVLVLDNQEVGPAISSSSCELDDRDQQVNWIAARAELTAMTRSSG